MLHRPPLARVRYADSHVHLDRYANDDVDQLIARAREAGVTQMLTVGVHLASSERGIALARRNPGIIAAAGVHPRYAGGIDVVALRRAIADGRDVVRAVGEIGLDRQQSGPPLGVQLVALQAQLALAGEVALPVVLHGAGAHADLAATLRSFRDGLPGAIVHYFVGREADVRGYLELDCYISFGRPILKPGQEALRALVPLVPADRLLAETDTYPLPGRATEPRDVVEVVRRLAELRGERVSNTAHTTLNNFRRALGLESVRP